MAEYLQEARDRRVDLNHYYVRPFLNETELRFLYPRTTLAVSRAGANTVAELVSFKIPTLFIPLPNASRDEQKLNAEYYVKKGAAFLLEQRDLDASSLRQKILALNRYQSVLRSKLRNLTPDLTASRKLLELVIKVAAENQNNE